MTKETIWSGDIIKDFNEKLQREREEVKRLREENERLREAIRECDSMKCTWLYEGTYKEMIE